MADPTELHSASQGNSSPARHQQHRHHKESHGRSNDIDENTEVEDVKAPSVLERFKEEVEAIVQAVHPHHHHHHEKHGDIDETTSVDEVKAPSILERIKEEFKAIFEAVHSKKKDSDGPN